MKLYNTLTRQVEDFVSHQPKKVKMYTCGPTVYHFAHLGNLRSYIMEDVLEKSLEYLGYSVERVMNITDVGHLVSDSDAGEDKMLKGARREHKTVMEIAKFYENAFFEDCKKLNIKKPSVVVPASEYISEYIKIIEELLSKGYAYLAGENVYFDTSKVENYYVFHEHDSDELMVAVRDDVDVDYNKKNKSDFVLWFTKSKFENQELKWDSPWGVGYPGWHIECTAISIKNLGEYVDIHCGGVDNVFPHHTNEIAQSEAYLGHEWCHYWFHVHHLNDKSGKMSKSNGDFLTVSRLEQEYDPLVYRMFCLLSHYRKPLEFSFEVLENVSTAYTKLLERIKRLQAGDDIDEASKKDYHDKFKNALENDLNTSMALTVVYDLLKDNNMNDATKHRLISEFDEVLSLNLLKVSLEKEIDDEFANYVENKIEERNNARKMKDFTLADKIRYELDEKGVIIKDTREGTTWVVK